jgi:hypothetical protein
LFTRVAPSLRAYLPEVYPTLTLGDLDKLIDILRESLDKYDGSSTEGAFLEWSIRQVVHPTAERLVKTRGIVQESPHSLEMSQLPALALPLRHWRPQQ